MPVLPNYFVTHQWLRELKRSWRKNLVGIYFRLPRDERVWVGHYNQNHKELPLGRAIRVILDAKDARGYELIVARDISPKAIHSIREIPQVVGWRYEPDAHGKTPCPCPVCLPRGSIRSARLRDD
jgi:hypothetical protein